MKTSDEIRTENLLKIVAERGGPTKFARLIKKNPTHISQWINRSLSSATGRRRVISARSCRHIEQVLDLPSGWMDHPAGVLAMNSASAPSDNAAHRALFCLPPIQISTSSEIAVPALPAQKVVTGDSEIDAVLWLREVIGTGNADLIAKAKEAAARITTPLKDIERRYRVFLRQANPGNPFADFSAFGFSDLDQWIGHSVTNAARRYEALARFGDTLFATTLAEQVCEDALYNLKRKRPSLEYDAAEVDKRFDALEAERPGTLTDCMLELLYWSELHWLRRAVNSKCVDDAVEVNARQDYVFRMLSRIPPRSPEEAAEVYRYLASNDGMDRSHTGAIILNLIGAPEPYRAKRDEA